MCLQGLLKDVSLWTAVLQVEYLAVYEGGTNMKTMAVGEFPVYAGLLMLVVDCILYLLLAVYFNTAFGGLLIVQLFV